MTNDKPSTRADVPVITDGTAVENDIPAFIDSPDNNTISTSGLKIDPSASDIVAVEATQAILLQNVITSRNEYAAQQIAPVSGTLTLSDGFSVYYVDLGENVIPEIEWIPPVIPPEIAQGVWIEKILYLTLTADDVSIYWASSTTQFVFQGGTDDVYFPSVTGMELVIRFTALVKDTAVPPVWNIALDTMAIIEDTR